MKKYKSTIYNRNKCKPAIWRKFSDNQRRVYNYVYETAAQSIIAHPKAPKHSQMEWATVKHNAACIAAFALCVVKV